MSYRRNLIIFLTHGLRSDVVSDSQVWPLKTPCLERLGSRGLRVVAVSACPSDQGGVVSLLTGLHARQHGMVSPTRGPVPIEGFPAVLAEGGYHIAGVGLVGHFEPWLDESVLVEDVDLVESSRCAYLQKMRTDGYGPSVQMQRRQRMRYGPFEPDRLLIEPDTDIDGFIGNEAKRLIATMPEDKPWALIVAFSGPGNELPPPTLYDGFIDPRVLERGFALADFTRLDAVAELDYPRIMLQRLEPQKLARLRSDYLGRVALIDYFIEVITEQTGGRGDRSRTWTLVASDRGHLLGEQGLVGRRSFLAGAVETPFIIAPPTSSEYEPKPVKDLEAELGGGPRFFDGLVSTVDVATTICAIASCDPPTASVGRSLLPALRGETVLPNLVGGVISEFGHRLMLETERYRLVYDVDAHHALGLFDLLNDPEERENIIDTPAGRNVLDALRWRLCDALIPLRCRPN